MNLPTSLLSQIIPGIKTRKPITIWYKRNKEGNFDFNHIEDGNISADEPLPVFDSQKGWLNESWEYEHAYISERGVIVKNP